MDNVALVCPITVKAKVTDDLKKQLAAEIQEAIQKTDLELQQLEFHAKRIMTEQVKQDVQGLTAIRQQVDAEKQKRLEFRNHMVEKLKETAQLELGSEIVQGNLQRMVTIAVGDNLHQMIASEILIEDGKVIAFRS